MSEPAAAGLRASLVLVSERGAEESYPLVEDQLVVGRDESANIVLQNAWVSRRHARIRSVAGSWSVTDEGSTHLTYLNKSVLKERQEHKLEHGDHLCLGGKVDFVFLERDDQDALSRVIALLQPAPMPGADDKDSYANQLSEEVKEIFTSLKDRASDATLVEQLNDKVAGSVRELRTLFDVGNAINAETELDKVLNLILTYVIRATVAERGFIMLLNEETGNLETQLARDLDQSLGEHELTTFSATIARRALEMNKTIVTKDTASDPDISSKSILDYNIRSAICAPLVAKGTPLGTLYVDAKQSLKEFSTKDVEFFTALANQSAIAVFNARLMESLRKANRGLQQKVRELEAVHDVTQRLLGDINMETVLETILDKSIEVLGAERSSIMFTDEGSDELRTRLVRGASWPQAAQGIKLKLGEGIAGEVAKSGKGHISNLGSQDPLFKNLSDRERDVRQILCAPLTLNNRRGVVNVINKKERESFTESDLKLVQSLASTAAVTIEKKRLHNLSIYDGLTGVFVHRYFQAVLTQKFEEARRHDQELSLMLIDIDHFKRFNDTYGHQVGDMVLAEVAAIFKRTARASDVVARYGGEEFVMILPETNLQGAAAFADRVRHLVESHAVKSRGGDLKVAVSIGVASLKAHSPTAKDELIRFADLSLYRAKDNGRNRVESYDASMSEEDSPGPEPAAE